MLSYCPPASYPIALVDTQQRTYSKSSTNALFIEADRAEKSIASSRFLSSQKVFAHFDQVLTNLQQIPDGWDSYGAPRPNAESIKFSSEILAGLRGILLVPDRILPSADGGVSLVFVSDTQSRAVIETLNSGETFALLYDLSGKSQTLELEDGNRTADVLIRAVKTHLRNDGLATDEA